jgi:GST-like protein
MIRFYYNLAPNPMKVALLLEELGLPYEAIPVDTRKGEQFDAAYTTLNPNGKVPAIIDDGVTVFDSNAILLHLADKTGQFLPPDTLQDRAALLSWLMFVATGIGPYSGQAVHFRHFAPEPKDYAHTRYQFEVRRHYTVLDAHLATRKFMLGESYTIVDMALWGWARMIPFKLGDDGWGELPNVKRWFDGVSARPAAQRALAIKDRHGFKTEMDAEARRVMFRHIAAA